MGKKHKRHKLNSYWSPYENGYTKPVENPANDIPKEPEEERPMIDVHNPNTLATLMMLGAMVRANGGRYV